MISNPLWENIPAELKTLPQWVFWKIVERQGRMVKLPFNARSGKLASTTDPSTWSTYEQAVRSSINGMGIGFVFTDENGYVGLDIDHAQEPDLVEWFGTYAEKSQSKQGVHIIMKAKIPPGTANRLQR